jgi:multidrug transporter EmrE-like cation transporter
MYIFLSLLAALSFTCGGVAMKYCDGYRNFFPSLMIYVMFAVGATLQTIAMKQAELGATYILVLGLEAALAFVFGIYFFQEGISFWKLCGVAMIVGGIILLRQE